MSKVRVHNLSMSIDGFVAGPKQSIMNPLGEGGEQLHEWAFATQRMRAIHGLKGGVEGIDNDWIARGDEGIGATIMGRNMFGPIRGPWPDESWRGWWGNDPPFHHPVFVLTHYAREPITMEGGTTFYFVTDGIQAALRRAIEAADGRDIRIGGGAATVREYLNAALIDELHLALVPILLGSGERLFEHVNGLPASYKVSEFVKSDAVIHVLITRRGD